MQSFTKGVPHYEGRSRFDLSEAIALTIVFIISLAMICLAIFIGVQVAIGIVRVTGISEYSAALLGPIIGYLILCVPGMIEAQVARRV